jgi:hypothetical protein
MQQEETHSALLKTYRQMSKLRTLAKSFCGISVHQDTDDPVVGVGKNVVMCFLFLLSDINFKCSERRLVQFC